jgi:hypothetical protein
LGGGFSVIAADYYFHSESLTQNTSAASLK